MLCQEHETETSEATYLTPPVNIRETKEAIWVEAEMPGVDKNQLEVLINENELTLIGRRPALPKETQVLWQEIPSLDFRRTFSLGNHIDRNNIHASFHDGVLRLKLGKSEEVKLRKIAIDA